MDKIIEDENLNFKFKIMGYEKGNELINIDNYLLNLYKSLSDIFIKYKIDSKFWICTKKRLITTSKQILNNYFDLHNINYISKKTVKNISTAINLGFATEENIDNIINLSLKKISPYELPIEFSKNSSTHDLITNNGVYFYSISLDKKNKNIIIPEYIHELIHTQLDSQNGVIINYHNREVLSIFLELLSAIKLDKNLLKNVLLGRYLDLYYSIYYINNNINDKKLKLEASIYIVSTLKALNLFNKYIIENNTNKEEILKYIQHILDGKESIEDFLDRYDISLENSKNENIIKKELIL